MATAGAAAGAAASAAEFSSAVYRLGKLRAAEMVPPARLGEGVRTAAADLSLTIETERRLDDGARLTFILVDDQGDKIVIRIDRQTQTLSLLTIDVGLLGPQHVARLVYERIQLALERERGAAPTTEGLDHSGAPVDDDRSSQNP